MEYRRFIEQTGYKISRDAYEKAFSLTFPEEKNRLYKQGHKRLSDGIVNSHVEDRLIAWAKEPEVITLNLDALVYNKPGYLVLKIAVQEFKKAFCRYLKISAQNKIGDNSAYILFKVTEGEAVIHSEKLILNGVSNARYHVLVAKNSMAEAYRNKIKELQDKFSIAPENIISVLEKASDKENYEKYLKAKKRSPKTPEEILERTEKRRLKYNAYQREYKRKLRGSKI